MSDNKFVKALINWDLIVSGIMLCVLVVCTFLGAISRYFFSSPFNWLEEVQLLCQVWIVFCGGCAAFRLGGHVEIEFVSECLPLAGQKIVFIINSIIIAVVLCYLGIQSYKYLQVFISSGRTTSVLGLSYVVIYVIAPISMILMVVNYLTTIKRAWKSLETEYEKKVAKKLAEKEGGNR